MGALLDKRDASVPEDLHTAMELLARDGSIPITTRKQRARSRRVANTMYGVPSGLVEALRSTPKSSHACIHKRLKTKSKKDMRSISSNLAAIF